MSTIPCHRGGHSCSWPACPADCDGRPGSVMHGVAQGSWEPLRQAFEAGFAAYWGPQKPEEVDGFLRDMSAAWSDYADDVLSAAQPPAAPVDLTDPVVVHANMLRGTIAKPTWEQIKHLYPEHFQSSAGNVDEVAAHFLACDAGSDISWAKTRLREWKDAVHYGDCTKAPITCNRCCADEAHERAKALLSVMPDVPQGAGK